MRLWLVTEMKKVTLEFEISLRQYIPLSSSSLVGSCIRIGVMSGST